MSIKKKSAKAKENKIADQPGLSRLFTPVSNSINLSNVLNRTLWGFFIHNFTHYIGIKQTFKLVLTSYNGYAYDLTLSLYLLRPISAAVQCRYRSGQSNKRKMLTFTVNANSKKIKARVLVKLHVLKYQNYKFQKKILNVSFSIKITKI